MPGFHALPNIIVFSLLGGVMYLGHHTGWKLPKISELTRRVPFGRNHSGRR
jgi:hypothetical protein